MLSESLAQYSALMVMRRQFNAATVKRVRRYELDQYLKGRAKSKKEMPLALEEHQAWVHYNKGSLAFFALQNYIGEETTNRVLAEFVNDHAFQSAPYPTSLELVERFRDATPEHLKYVIDDLFTTITLHDKRVTPAIFQRRDDGKYEVVLQFQSKKFHGTRDVKNEEVPVNDWIEIGVTTETGTFQYLEKHLITSAKNPINIVVPDRPMSAGIDPRNILIDRLPDDNMVDVTPSG